MWVPARGVGEAKPAGVVLDGTTQGGIGHEKPWDLVFKGFIALRTVGTQCFDGNLQNRLLGCTRKPDTTGTVRNPPYGVM